MRLILPALAITALRRAALPGEFVSRADGPLHITVHATFTPGGALRRRHRPVCGQPARRWYLADPDGRPLCRRCAGWLRRHVDLSTRLPITVELLYDALMTATTVAEVDAVQTAALTANLTRRLVDHPDRTWGRIPFHRLLHDTRSRLTHPSSFAAPASWQQRIDADRRWSA